MARRKRGRRRSRRSKNNGASRQWRDEEVLRLMLGQHTPDTDQDPAVIEVIGGGLDSKASKLLWGELSPEKLVTQVADLGTNVLYLYAKDAFGNCYFPASAGHVHSLMQGRDFFGEVIGLCRQRKIVPVGVFDLRDRRVQDEHPDWCWQRGGEVAGPCLCGPFADHVTTLLAEVLDRYTLGGLLVDAVAAHAWGDVACPHCRERWAVINGRDAWPDPAGLPPSERRDWFAFHRGLIAEFMDKVRGVVEDKADDTTLYHRFAEVECPAAGHTWRLDRNLGIGIHTHALGLPGCVDEVAVPKGSRVAIPEQRSCAVIDVGYGPGSEGGDPSTARPPAAHWTQVASVLANGLAVSQRLEVQYDGTLDPTQTALVKKTQNYWHDRRNYLLGVDHVPFAALVRPAYSAELMGSAEQYRGEFDGWVRMLTENHVLYDVLADEMFDAQSLAAYRVVVLPHVEVLSRTQITAVRRFVEMGGMLIATGNTSRVEDHGKVRKNLGLGQVLGVNLREPLVNQPGYIYIQAKELSDDRELAGDWLHMPDGLTRVTARRGSRILAKRGDRLGDGHLAHLRYDSGQPAIVCNQDKGGRAWYIAGLPGLAYVRFGYPGVAALVRRMLEPAISEHMPVVVDAPACVQVEATFKQEKGWLIVHVINRGADPGLRSRLPGIDLPAAGVSAPNIRVRVRDDLTGQVKRAFLAPEGRQLSLDRSNDTTTVQLPPVDIHSILIAELG